ncbi:MAG: FtsX-like permease family protein [Acidobacteria bacterium]|nr:FtsX-like permease family protein [Acidobacteriota bacterium]
MSPHSRSPRLARRLIEILTPRAQRTGLVGDLEEAHSQIVQSAGAAAARRWYWRQTLSTLLRMPAEQWAARPARAVMRIARASGSDIRFAARGLTKQPGFALPALCIFTVGVAANAVVFSFVDAVLLRSLPYPNAEDVVMLWPRVTEANRGELMSTPTYRHAMAWAERSQEFPSLAAYESAVTTLRTPARTAPINGLNISASWNDVLGVEPIRGRSFTTADDTPGAPPVAIISFDLWHNELNADPAIIGRAIDLDGTSTAVVGVMPEDFWFFDPYMFFRSSGDRSTADVHLWLPLHRRSWEGWIADYPSLRVLARRAPGLSTAAARDAAEAVARGLGPIGDTETIGVEVKSLADELREPVRAQLTALFAAGLLVLAIVAANLGSLSLTRADGRRVEMAVRAALGAGRARLLRLALAENLLIALAGSFGGLLLAAVVLDTVVRIAPRALPLAHSIHLDARVAAFGVLVAALGALAGGLVPAFRTVADSIPTQLTRAGRTEDVGGNRTRSILVAAEVAISVTLLIAATLMLRTFVDLHSQEPGFDAESVLTFQSSLTTVPGEPPNLDFYPELLRTIQTIPGVVAAGGTTHLPFSEWGAGAPEIIIGDAEPDPDTRGERMQVHWILPGYVAAAGIDVLQGETLKWSDEPTTNAIVNAAFVEQHLDGQPALGTSVGTVSRSEGISVTRFRIVGVIGNYAQSSLGEKPQPRIFVDGRDKVWMHFIVRAQGEPAALTATIRGIARDLDPAQPLGKFARWQYLVEESLSSERFYSSLLGAFGLIALLLAAAGVYGTVSYTVSARLPEFGIRKALGADDRTIARLVVSSGLAPVLAGALVGLLGATAATRSMGALLHGTSPTDPSSYALAVGVFLGVAVLAVLPPARRASRLDPIEVLRTD